ncbi:MAG: O-antigen ligase family protein [Syntrophales bacterium]
MKLGLYTDGQHEIPSNIIGITTLFGLLLSLYQLTREDIIYRKIILTICVCATTVATLATQTMGAILAMIVSLIVLSLRNKKALLFFLFFLALVTSVMPIKYKLTPGAFIDKIRADPRINIWYNYFEIIKDHPVIGIGFGMQTTYDDNLLNKYNEKVPAEYREPIPHKAPHNLLIGVAVRTGLVGLILFLYIIFKFFQVSWRIIKSGKDDFIRHWGLCFLAAFVAVFIQGQFENTMSGPPVIVFYTIMAMMTILWRLNTMIDAS